MATILITDSELKKLISIAEKTHIDGTDKPTCSLSQGGGLVLKRLNSGKWVWWVRYRFGGKENNISLGEYPLTTLAQARAGRDEVKTLIQKGTDPAAHRDEQKAAARLEAENSFKAVALQWWDNWRTGKEID